MIETNSAFWSKVTAIRSPGGNVYKIKGGAK